MSSLWWPETLKWINNTNRCTSACQYASETIIKKWEELICLISTFQATVFSGAQENSDVHCFSIWPILLQTTPTRCFFCEDIFTKAKLKGQEHIVMLLRKLSGIHVNAAHAPPPPLLQPPPPPPNAPSCKVPGATRSTTSCTSASFSPSAAKRNCWQTDKRQNQDVTKVRNMLGLFAHQRQRLLCQVPPWTLSCSPYTHSIFLFWSDWPITFYYVLMLVMYFGFGPAIVRFRHLVTVWLFSGQHL